MSFRIRFVRIKVAADFGFRMLVMMKIEQKFVCDWRINGLSFVQRQCLKMAWRSKREPLNKTENLAFLEG